MPDQKVLKDFIALFSNIEDSETIIEIKHIIDEKLEILKQAEVEAFILKGQELSKNYGVSLDELASSISSTKGKGLKIKHKYQSKTNKDDAWSGRGKQPQWVKDYLEADSSHTLEDLLVDQ